MNTSFLTRYWDWKMAFFLGICVLVVWFSRSKALPVPPPPDQRPKATDTTTDTPARDDDPLMVDGATCQGTEIAVSYPYAGDQVEPFECKPYCSKKGTEFHYILYTNGYATQCGSTSCQDKGEDECVSCKAPPAVLKKYNLPTPTAPLPCTKN